MYRESGKESTIKLLFMIIKKHEKSKKAERLYKLKLKGETPKTSKIEYKLSEYKLNNVRQNMQDLEHRKLTGCIAPNLVMINAINDKLEMLRKEENQIIKYRLKA